MYIYKYIYVYSFSFTVLVRGCDRVCLRNLKRGSITLFNYAVDNNIFVDHPLKRLGRKEKGVTFFLISTRWYQMIFRTVISVSCPSFAAFVVHLNLGIAERSTSVSVMIWGLKSPRSACAVSPANKTSLGISPIVSNAHTVM